MTKVQPFKIAIAGIGTVGGGVLDILNKKKAFFSSKGINLKVSVIATRRPLKNLSNLKNAVNLKSAEELLSFSDYDLLVETIGGESDGAERAFSTIWFL